MLAVLTTAVVDIHLRLHIRGRHDRLLAIPCVTRDVIRVIVCGGVIDDVIRDVICGSVRDVICGGVCDVISYVTGRDVDELRLRLELLPTPCLFRVPPPPGGNLLLTVILALQHQAVIVVPELGQQRVVPLLLVVLAALDEERELVDLEVSEVQAALVVEGEALFADVVVLALPRRARLVTLALLDQGQGRPVRLVILPQTDVNVAVVPPSPANTWQIILPFPCSAL